MKIELNSAGLLSRLGYQKKVLKGLSYARKTDIVTLEIEEPVYINCTACNGRGITQDFFAQRCPKCNGSGLILKV